MTFTFWSQLLTANKRCSWMVRWAAHIMHSNINLRTWYHVGYWGCNFIIIWVELFINSFSARNIIWDHNKPSSIKIKHWPSVIFWSAFAPPQLDNVKLIVLYSKLRPLWSHLYNTYVSCGCSNCKKKQKKHIYGII